jgi:hypothetical protein
MDIHKDCYSAIDLTQQDGPHRRKTIGLTDGLLCGSARARRPYLGPDDPAAVDHLAGLGAHAGITAALAQRNATRIRGRERPLTPRLLSICNLFGHRP